MCSSEKIIDVMQSVALREDSKQKKKLINALFELYERAKLKERGVRYIREASLDGLFGDFICRKEDKSN